MVDYYPILICNWVAPTTSRRVHVIKYKPRYFHTDNYLQPTDVSKWNSRDISRRIQIGI